MAGVGMTMMMAAAALRAPGRASQPVFEAGPVTVAVTAVDNDGMTRMMKTAPPVLQA